MFFRRIKTPGIAHTAYIIGRTGHGVIVDPRRDVDEYLRVAHEGGLSIEYVLETHRQEDFVMGGAELARITGAQIVNGKRAHELFGHGDILLDDGESLEVDGLVFKALHTPGHTPESVTYALYLNDVPGRCWGAFTGDALFIGDTGRTDLTDEAKTGEHAGVLYDAVHEKIAPLGDQVLLFPAHGAGSVCGGGMADRDDSTLGLERAYNPVFVKSRDDFVRSKLEERIPRPPYFERIERVNLRGGLPSARVASGVPVLQPIAFESSCRDGLVIDTREPEAFAGGHIPGAHSIWLQGLGIFAGWVADDRTPVYLVLDRPSDLEAAVLVLTRIGVDQIEGVLAGGFSAWRNAGLEIEESGTISARELAEQRREYVTLDVREDSEFEEQHMPGAKHAYVGGLEQEIDEMNGELQKDKPVAVTCSVGNRASLATSMLLRRGYKNVRNVLGGMTAWSKLELPAEKGP